MLRRMLLAYALLLPLLASAANAQAQVNCQFVLGFKTLHDLDPADIGDCQDNQFLAASGTGDQQQHTAKGLMAWRKADNWTAFTNGFMTWINGPNGLASRLNTQRFSWEADFGAPGTTPADSGGTAPPPSGPAPAPVTWPSSGPGWSAIPAPDVAAAGPPAQWIKMSTPAGQTLVAAVFRPQGSGPFPVVIFLHASGGFSWPYTLSSPAVDMPQGGAMVVAGCWFEGASPRDPPAPGLVDCPQAPPFNGANLDSVRPVASMVNIARQLPGAVSQHVGIMGQSRGADAAVLVASTGTTVQAVVSDSGGYTNPNNTPIDTPSISLVQNLSSPVLILHGTADQTVPVQSARAYEAALAKAGKPYEAAYFDGAPHVLLAKNNSFYRDASNRAYAFLRKYLLGS